MTLRQAAFVAQCLRRWGYEAKIENCNRDVIRYRVFVCGGLFTAYVHNYGQAVNYR